MDAISLLKNDHNTVEGLFSRYEATSDGASATRRDLVDQIIKELSIHAAIEEQVFYPAVRLAAPDAEDEVLEGLEEHHIVKWTISELETLAPDDERFHPKVTVLMESVRHHVEEEEGEMFPKVRSALDSGQLEDLGNRLEAAKRGAPTHPHPRSFDAPPGNLVTGAVAGVMDRARDLGRGAIETARDAIGDARDAGEEAVQEARRAAERSGDAAAESASAATKSVASTARKARSSAKRSTKKATGSGKRTAKKATGSGKRTAKKATGSGKRTAKKATGSGKRTAKKAAGSGKRTAKKATGSAKRSAKRSSGSAKRSSGSAKKTATKSAKSTRKSTKATSKRSSR